MNPVRRRLKRLRYTGRAPRPEWGTDHCSCAPDRLLFWWGIADLTEACRAHDESAGYQPGGTDTQRAAADDTFRGNVRLAIIDSGYQRPVGTAELFWWADFYSSTYYHAVRNLGGIWVRVMTWFRRRGIFA